MDSQRDCEEFIRRFNEFQKENGTNISFSIYKSKVDRVNQGANYKKYNFNNNEQINNYQQGMYRSYNDLIINNPQASNFRILITYLLF